MMRVTTRTALPILCLALLSAASCSSAPARVEAPNWNPSRFADAIIKKLDTNGDGLLDRAEVTEAPGLEAGFRFIDTDGDNQLSREELEARFELYRERRLGLTPKQFRILYKGRPLVGAEVRLVPEFFLADLLEPASGTTGHGGLVEPTIEDSNVRMPVMRVGYYRVEVTSPRVELPAQFNTATTVGVEVSPISEDADTYGVIEVRLE